MELRKRIAAGLSKEIARELVPSEKTVRNHIGNISSKRHVCERSQAMRYPIRQGWVKG